MDPMFYLEWGFWMVTAIIMSGIRQNHAVWIWRLLTLLSCMDLVISLLVGRAWWDYGMVLILLMYCFLYLPWRGKVSICPHCGRRMYYKMLVGNSCPYCHRSVMRDSYCQKRI